MGAGDRNPARSPCGPRSERPDGNRRVCCRAPPASARGRGSAGPRREAAAATPRSRSGHGSSFGTLRLARSADRQTEAHAEGVVFTWPVGQRVTERVVPDEANAHAVESELRREGELTGHADAAVPAIHPRPEPDGVGEIIGAGHGADIAILGAHDVAELRSDPQTKTTGSELHQDRNRDVAQRARHRYVARRGEGAVHDVRSGRDKRQAARARGRFERELRLNRPSSPELHFDEPAEVPRSQASRVRDAGERRTHDVELDAALDVFRCELVAEEQHEQRLRPCRAQGQQAERDGNQRPCDESSGQGGSPAVYANGPTLNTMLMIATTPTSNSSAAATRVAEIG